MASEVAMRYAVKGAKQAQRADRKVRESVQRTADVAQRESGTISRWMDRHQTAIASIGLATAGVLGSILASSSLLRAELNGVRLAFSLFADTIVSDVLPSGDSLSSMAFDAAAAYEQLPTPIRKAISWLVVLTTVVGGAVAAVGFLGPAFIAGAKLIGGAVATIAGLISGTLVAIILVVVGVVALLYLAWKNNWFRIRDVTANAIRGLKAGYRAFVEALRGDTSRLMGILRRIWNGYWSWYADLWGGIVKRAIQWGKDLIGNLASGIKQRARQLKQTVKNIVGDIKSRLSFDIASNDRMARRWGRDLVSEFAAGMQAARPQLQTSLGAVGPAAPRPTTGGGGGNTVVVEELSVTVAGRGTSRADGREVGQSAAEELQDQFAARR